ncbi:MAG: glutamate synthase subunit beta [Bacteroidaceae bacterium]|nr:glutamate synthase subunit beta [Bacteroidaceae bacterium]
MGNPKSFMTVPRKEAGYRPIHDRIHDFGEVEQTLNTKDRQEQAGRCMECGVPFCHWACPLGSRIPEWNDALYRGNFEEAYHILNRTNDFPEFTGRVCPALCEKSCILNHVLHEPTTNRENECAVAERAFMEQYAAPRRIGRNGRRVAVIGSGPAGLAAANRLNWAGYTVTVIERNEAAGGLLRFGIPNFKLNKAIIDRRIRLMEAEGVQFQYDTEVDIMNLPTGYDAYAVCTGTPQARDLAVEGRDLKGVHLALELLGQQNRILAGQDIPDGERISCKGKKVLVIGGGDTGSDCIGTAHRQGSADVTQIEIMPKPPVGDNPATPWPNWPVVLKTSFAHEEGCERRWLLNTNKFIGQDGRLTGAEVEEVEWRPNPEGGRPVMHLTGRKEVIQCDLAFLAMGFLRPQQPELPDNVFVAGDAANGASLVVKAMASGQQAARRIDAYLNGK